MKKTRKEISMTTQKSFRYIKEIQREMQGISIPSVFLLAISNFNKQIEKEGQKKVYEQVLDFKYSIEYIQDKKDRKHSSVKLYENIYFDFIAHADELKKDGVKYKELADFLIYELYKKIIIKK